MNYTIRQLKEAISTLPDDMPVYYGRIEDEYFTDHNWKTEDVDWEALSWDFMQRFGTEMDRALYRPYTEDLDALRRDPGIWGSDYVDRNRHRWGPNGESFMQQSEAINAFSGFVTYSQTLDRKVFFITAHY